MSHEALNDEQFGEQKQNLAQMLGVHPSIGGGQVGKVIRGRVARHVMARADIRQTKKLGEVDVGHGHHTADVLVDMPHVANAGFDWGGTYERGYPHGEVWTSQQHLHIPTLRQYATKGPMKFDPDYYEAEADDPSETEVPYEPETYGHGGKEWLLEGHHRTVARRLTR